jgi:hypothetical protein
MSDPEEGPEGERFLTRWSRRKREASEAGTPEAAAEPLRDERAGDEQPAAPVLQDHAAVVDEAGFDAAKLPSIDSIGVDTDIRGFLRQGVPPDLTRAALRRAWSSDPAIRDYIGPVENGWDFNDPAAMAGFGPLEAVKNMAKLVAQAIGESEPQSAPAATGTELAEALPSAPQDGPPLQSVDPRAKEGDAPQSASARKAVEEAVEIPDGGPKAAEALPASRRGGGALPV